MKYLWSRHTEIILWAFFGVGIAIIPLFADSISAGDIPSPGSKSIVVQAQQSSENATEYTILNSGTQTEPGYQTTPPTAPQTPQPSQSKTHPPNPQGWWNHAYKHVFNSREILIVAVALLGTSFGDLLCNLFKYGEADPQTMPKTVYAFFFGFGILTVLMCSQIYGSDGEPVGGWHFSLFLISCIHGLLIKLLWAPPPPATTNSSETTLTLTNAHHSAISFKPQIANPYIATATLKNTNCPVPKP